MRVALDTNILVNAEGLHGAERKLAARRVIDRLPASETVVPVQVVGELFNVMVRKAGWPRDRARESIAAWRATYDIVDSSAAVIFAAVDIAVAHRLQIWDSVVLAAAVEADCRLLLSEDLQDGFTWSGVTVVNPFAPSPHPLLKTALQTE
jgi:predicted nucleic acid-binding protein